MNIVVQPSDYRFLNAGDSAMMSVAMRRLGAIWPEAHFHVLTDHPEILPSYSPNVTALSNTGRVLWSTNSPWDSPRTALARKLLNGTHAQLSNRFPRITSVLRGVQLRRHPEALATVKDFLDLMSDADAFITTGMGGLTSAFPEYARILLDTVELATARSIPTILMGQGLGPFEDEELGRRAAAIVPRVDYIALREGLHGPRLLQSWGMNASKWTVTGDDALELATGRGCAGPRLALGLNARLSDYSGVTFERAERLREPVLRFTKRIGAPIRVIPISRMAEERDAENIEALFHSRSSIEQPPQALDSPERVIDFIQGCRVVVTGSYHAGVFALGQGIPVIGLAISPYYQWKFSGLAHQFPGGCEVLAMDAPRFADQLADALERLWGSAPDLFDSLRATAGQQISAGRSAYNHLKSLVHSS